MKKRYWLNLIVIILLIAFSFYRYKQRIYTVKNSQIMMDTQIDISISSKNKSVNRIVDKSFNIVRIFDDKFSYYNENSDLNKINASTSDSINIDRDFYDIFKIAEDIYQQSNGLYDVSIGNLIELWDFNEGDIPSKEKLDSIIGNDTFELIQFDSKILKKPKNMKINLGSISKGFIIDKAMSFVVKQGVEEAFINAGGDLKVYRKDEKPIKIGIQHPRIPNKIIATLKVSNKAVVTSGDYERYFEKDGKRYHHIINPKTGFPAQNTISVTVISESATLADALSTALFVMNPIDGIDLIKQYPETEAIIYYQSGDGLISLKSEGMKEYIVSELNIDTK
ncbi:MAG: FAD:protein FMN transferase [Candidatus Cloacimonadales bacterium]|nr:FAD:protein FMN transferase [Candidatus Cloacimonadota bacterium]MDD2651319.1 FAD:protein FMN transferase [Candidatus Cloacimonadota bacterium]MDD3501607.1 FAD:protein FMN transferase [Candidatus Cloacimonadota bacterium]MDX9977222.1 FAD:protein FMN transferase [Candidatus Cloacimonadales bacterium]